MTSVFGLSGARRPVCRFGVLRTLIMLVILACCEAGAFERPLQGRALADVLDGFRAEGIPLVYSTSLVDEHLRVLEEPDAREPLDIIAQCLSPHGLAIRETDGLFLVVRAAGAAAAPAAAGTLSTILIIVQNVDELVDGSRVTLSTVPSLPPPRRLTDGVLEMSDVAPGSYDVEVGAPGFFTAERSVEARPGEIAVVSLVLTLAPLELDELNVSASRYVLFSNSQFFVDQRAIQSLPDLGEDPIRAAHRLPGSAATGLSSRSHFRGGEQNETAIYLNGLKLLDPFHVRNYHSIFSAIDHRAISGVEAYTGGFPAEFGDHMSGVLLLDSMKPREPLHFELGFSVYNSSLLNSGYAADGRVDWLVSARRSNLELFLDADLGEPDYHDAFAEIGFELTDSTRISVNGLLGNDSVTVITEPDAEELEISFSDTDNRHVWAVMDNQWTTDLGSRTVLSFSTLRDRRDSEVNDPDQYVGEVLDVRNIDVAGLRQDWTFAGIADHQLRWGWEMRRHKAEFDYTARARYLELFESWPGIENPKEVAVSASPRGYSYALYMLDRWRLNERWMVEGGLRWDRQTYTRPIIDSQLSPRLSLLHTFVSGTQLRFSWGRYYQPQAVHDLQVEDGLDRYFPPQRSEHFIAGLQRAFAKSFRIRVEAFQKNYDRLKPRFENLFDTLALIPELEPDRVRLAPEKGRVRGLEISLEYRSAEELTWWISYSLSKATDTVGGRRQLRSWDQRHAVQAGLGWQHGPWELGLAVHVHSAWPTTGLTLGFDVEEDESFRIIGGRNAEQLNTFATLDFRIARRFDIGKTRLTAFIEVTNAADRLNICCVDFDTEEDENEFIFLDRAEDYWLPIVPAAGLLWEF